MRHFVPLVAFTLACNAEVTIADEGSSPPPFDGSLVLVEGPTVLLGPDFSGARVVARIGGFDLVSGGPMGIAARRLELTGEPFLRQEPLESLQPGEDNLLIATARDDRLALCSRSFDGLSTVRQYDGSYSLGAEASIGAWNDFSCNGLAWNDGRGVASWRLCPQDGGLCYAVVQELDESGVPLGEPTTALGDGELWVAGVTAYGSGLAWAGGMGGPLQVWFSPAPGSGTRVDVAGAQPGDGTPRLASWPFRDDAVAVTWDETRLVVLTSGGATLVDRALVDATTHSTTRPALASNALGLVTAHAECELDAEQGSLVVSLWGASGESDEVRLPTACPTEAASVAVLDEHVLVLWPHRQSDGYQGALLRIVSN